MELEWHAFFAAIKHEHNEEVLDILQKYDIGRYIVSREKVEGAHADTDGEHFHFMVEMYRTDYNRLAKRLFIDRFKLRGRACVGHPRQYGKVKNIENVELMQAYTVKDGNVSTNLTDEELEVLKEKSYKKENKRKLYDAVMSALATCEFNLYGGYREMRDAVARTYIKEQIKADLTKSILERYLRLYILYHADITDQEKLEWLNVYVWGIE
jgi:hypothetical protein